MGATSAAVLGAGAVYVVLAVAMALLPHVQEVQHELYASAARRAHRGAAADGTHVDADNNVAVVLGYACDAAGRPTPLLRNRVEMGLELFVRGDVDHILFTGSHDGRAARGGRSEAACMRAYAAEVADRRFGAEARRGWERRWYLEEESTSTRENAEYSLRTLLFGMRRLIIVTNRFHMLRAVWTFQRAAREIEERAAAAGEGAGEGGAGAPVSIAMGPLDAGADAVPVSGLAAVWESQFLLVRELCALVYYAGKDFL